jgi:hypothetical protein
VKRVLYLINHNCFVDLHTPNAIELHRYHKCPHRICRRGIGYDNVVTVSGWPNLAHLPNIPHYSPSGIETLPLYGLPEQEIALTLIQKQIDAANEVGKVTLENDHFASFFSTVPIGSNPRSDKKSYEQKLHDQNLEQQRILLQQQQQQAAKGVKYDNINNDYVEFPIDIAAPRTYHAKGLHNKIITPSISLYAYKNLPPLKSNRNAVIRPHPSNPTNPSVPSSLVLNTMIDSMAGINNQDVVSKINWSPPSAYHSGGGGGGTNGINQHVTTNVAASNITTTTTTTMTTTDDKDKHIDEKNNDPKQNNEKDLTRLINCDKCELKYDVDIVVDENSDHNIAHDLYEDILHSAQPSFKHTCHRCRLEFTHQNGLLSHKNDAHNDNKIPCPTCNIKLNQYTLQNPKSHHNLSHKRYQQALESNKGSPSLLLLVSPPTIQTPPIVTTLQTSLSSHSPSILSNGNISTGGRSNASVGSSGNRPTSTTITSTKVSSSDHHHQSNDLYDGPANLVLNTTVATHAPSLPNVLSLRFPCHSCRLDCPTQASFTHHLNFDCPTSQQGKTSQYNSGANTPNNPGSDGVGGGNTNSGNNYTGNNFNIDGSNNIAGEYNNGQYPPPTAIIDGEPVTYVDQEGQPISLTKRQMVCEVCHDIITKVTYQRSHLSLHQKYEERAKTNDHQFPCHPCKLELSVKPSLIKHMARCLNRTNSDQNYKNDERERHGGDECDGNSPPTKTQKNVKNQSPNVSSQNSPQIGSHHNHAGPNPKRPRQFDSSPQLHGNDHSTSSTLDIFSQTDEIDERIGYYHTCGCTHYHYPHDFGHVITQNDSNQIIQKKGSEDSDHNHNHNDQSNNTNIITAMTSIDDTLATHRNTNDLSCCTLPCNDHSTDDGLINNNNNNNNSNGTKKQAIGNNNQDAKSMQFVLLNSQQDDV